MENVIYLALGDSLTEGIGASSPDSCFVPQYFRHIKVSTGCRLLNMGVSGMTASELLRFLESPILKKLIPQVSHMTVTTGGCDFIQWYETNLTLTGLVRTMRSVRVQVGRLLDQIRQLNGEADLKVLGFYLPPPAYEKGFLLASRALRAMNLVYSQLCVQYQAYFINPFDTFLNRLDYFADEVHPNQQGYDELARLFREMKTNEDWVPQTPLLQ